MAKYNSKITLIILSMFIITQIIGLFVVNFYNQNNNQLPYGMEPPEEIKQNPAEFPIQILFAFLIAISLFFVLTKINAEKFIRLWFFIVTTIAIGLSLNVIFSGLLSFLWYASFMALIIALPLAYIKIFKRDLFVHNITELLIYPGIAAVFVPILGVLGIIILLLAISLYDMWAVWKSEFMQKMARYQIDKLKFFTGFFIPFANKSQRKKIKLLKEKYKNKGPKVLEKQFKRAKIKVNLAILGGGDVIFPIITAGVFLRVMGIIPALIITLSATIGLLGLMALAKKKKYYPAMPFLAGAMYLGMMAIFFLKDVLGLSI